MPRPKATAGTAKLPPFVAWIDTYEVNALAAKLDVTRGAVWAWRRGALNLAMGRPMREGKGSQPSPGKLGDIIALARGQLKASDIYPRKAKEAQPA